MTDIFDPYIRYEVPWWNEAVNNPESKLPKTMKYLEGNFTYKEYMFRRSQIVCGLKKRQEDMVKMTTPYLTKPPIMALLLWYCIKGSPFLRALLSVLVIYIMPTLECCILVISSVKAAVLVVKLILSTVKKRECNLFVFCTPFALPTLLSPTIHYHVCPSQTSNLSTLLDLGRLGGQQFS